MIGSKDKAGLESHLQQQGYNSLDSKGLFGLSFEVKGETFHNYVLIRPHAFWQSSNEAILCQTKREGSPEEVSKILGKKYVHGKIASGVLAAVSVGGFALLCITAQNGTSIWPEVKYGIFQPMGSDYLSIAAIVLGGLGSLMLSSQNFLSDDFPITYNARALDNLEYQKQHPGLMERLLYSQRNTEKK